ncbi:hypothetical protein BDV93DRAFT_521628 [Ceratobasidium sp. AG-I]|nr:hypothetical protein BDV93DRAFT_521628 [Ceratobasidium sp. AG-I]
MYNYKQALAVLGLAIATTSAVTVPRALFSELPSVLPIDIGANTEVVKVNDGHQTEFGDSMGDSSLLPRTHVYDPKYDFSARDGWETIPITDLSYKYGNTTRTRSEPATQKRQRSDVKRGVGANVLGGTISHALGETWNSLKGAGKAQGVTITWYTGEDLQNPSCWPESDWAPTDASFACALTLQGWTTKPSCFKFLELCNGPDKCIFVRVVDTCAGCKKGSKHVDLTKSAFAELADLDVGILTVQMRMASNPQVWHTNLWGPKI